MRDKLNENITRSVRFRRISVLGLPLTTKLSNNASLLKVLIDRVTIVNDIIVKYYLCLVLLPPCCVYRVVGHFCDVNVTRNNLSSAMPV